MKFGSSPERVPVIPWSGAPTPVNQYWLKPHRSSRFSVRSIDRWGHVVRNGPGANSCALPRKWLPMQQKWTFCGFGKAPTAHESEQSLWLIGPFRACSFPNSKSLFAMGSSAQKRWIRCSFRRRFRRRFQRKGSEQDGILGAASGSAGSGASKLGSERFGAVDDHYWPPSQKWTGSRSYAMLRHEHRRTQPLIQQEPWGRAVHEGLASWIM